MNFQCRLNKVCIAMSALSVRFGFAPRQKHTVPYRTKPEGNDVNRILLTVEARVNQTSDHTARVIYTDGKNAPENTYQYRIAPSRYSLKLASLRLGDAIQSHVDASTSFRLRNIGP